MEIWKKGNEIWPDEVVLYIEGMPFNYEEVQSLKEVTPHIECWLKKKNRYEEDSDDSSDQDEDCKCHKSMRNIMLPCGEYLEK